MNEQCSKRSGGTKENVMNSVQVDQRRGHRRRNVWAGMNENLSGQAWQGKAFRREGTASTKAQRLEIGCLVQRNGGR